VQKNIPILFIILFFCDFVFGEIVNLEIMSKCAREDLKTFRCELFLSIPAEWKLSRAPYVSILKSKNLKNFKYNENYEKLNSTTYKIYFTIEMENEKVKDNQLKLSVDCPVCSNICTIISKNIDIILDSEHKKPSFSKIFILLLGFLGGLILNFMPCVLPVIIMKLKSFESKNSIYGSIAGNYASFAIFTTCLAFLKISGETIGWGMHFQNPHFLELTTLVLFGLTLYSFEIISFFPSVRVENNKYQMFCGNFISSMVASMVAIPCTAPFLGTAAAFAIQGSIFDLYLIFFTIATGFSIPYFISFIVPADFFLGLGRHGKVLKKIINYGVMITFLWIFLLLSNHLSQMATAMYVLSFIIFALLLKKRSYPIAAVVLGICFCGWMHRDLPTKAAGFSQNPIIEVIPELANERVIIFNIIADWCLTCKYNRRIFSDKKVIESIKNNNVKFVEADITRKDDTLIKFIEGYNRVGIPFTIVYGPRAKRGILLDEILTAGALLNAIENAK
jgi:suppressor for copper-sensitivity B